MANVFKRGSTFYLEFYLGGRRVRRSLRTSKKSEAPESDNDFETAPVNN